MIISQSRYFFIAMFGLSISLDIVFWYNFYCIVDISPRSEIKLLIINLIR